MMRLLRMLESLSGVFLLFMAVLTSVSSFGRYFLSAPIPDEYEISRLLLGVVICMGVASAFTYDEHIQLDIFWGSMPQGVKNWLSGLGISVCMLATAGFSWALAVKVLDSYDSELRTVDLGLPIWVFHALAWLASLMIVLVLVAKLVAQFALIRSRRSSRER